MTEFSPFVIWIARAINPDWQTLSANSKRNTCITVRETLRAAREPTPEMIAAGDDTNHTIEAMSEYPHRLQQIAAFWRAMVDEAIKP